MSSAKIGERVWAVRSADGPTVYSYGHGTYLGDHLRPGWLHPADIVHYMDAVRRGDDDDRRAGWYDNPAGAFAAKIADGTMSLVEAEQICVRAKDRREYERSRPLSERVLELAYYCGLNPLIGLDDGGTVWGIECWWREEDEMPLAKIVGGRPVVTVPAPHPQSVAAYPHRVQHRRVRGWRKPDGAVCVSRPSPFSNPYKIEYVVRAVAGEQWQVTLGGVLVSAWATQWLAHAEATELYRRRLHADPALRRRVATELSGKPLCCFCRPGLHCHVDVLLLIAALPGGGLGA